MRRIAILVANSKFSPASGLPALRFPVADIQAVQELLCDKDIGKYDRVVVLIDKRSNEILTEINSVLDEERGASVLFYYSGHGKPSDSGKLYLAAADTTDRLLPSTAVSFSSLLEMKDSYGFGRFAAILDCCFAGLASPDIKGTEDDRLKAFTEGRGVFFLGAANATQAAKEDVQLGHGFLTAGVIEGLKSGRADVDGDGRISGPDLFAWCRDFARQRGAHLPVQVNRVADDDLVLAYSRKRLSAGEIERVRAKLILTFENRLMPTGELDRLRAYFIDQIVVPVPAPHSLEGTFLAYATGKIGWAEIGEWRKEGRTTSVENDSRISPAPIISKKSFFSTVSSWPNGNRERIAVSILILAVLAFGIFYWFQTRTQPSSADSDPCKQYPALCPLSKPTASPELECFNGLGNCPNQPAISASCLKGLGDCARR